MVKVHILGAPGSGKTTLAQDLSSQLHIPHYDLDKVNWEQENAIALASQPAWIAEGIYLIEPMLYHADYIVWLEVSWPVAAWRMIRRHILNSLHGTNPYPGINGVKALFNLLKYARRYILNLDHSDKASVEAFRMYLETHRDIATQPTEDFLQAYFEVYQGPIVPPTAALTRTILEGYKEKFFPIRNITDRERLLERLT
ncbi:hypothetical protein ccbrp13_07450 [Ktedonobacteria bacterium brp13]|nr:hypothetical protein ccbrp13_07450 [Ktedonobacteria bacterium brp13]